jgi:hypothetical protein
VRIGACSLGSGGRRYDETGPRDAGGQLRLTDQRKADRAEESRHSVGEVFSHQGVRMEEPARERQDEEQHADPHQVEPQEVFQNTCRSPGSVERATEHPRQHDHGDRG